MKSFPFFFAGFIFVGGTAAVPVHADAPRSASSTAPEATSKSAATSASAHPSRQVDPAAQRQADAFLATLAAASSPDDPAIQPAIDKLTPAAYEPLHAALMNVADHSPTHQRLEAVFAAVVLKLDPRYLLAQGQMKWSSDLFRRVYDATGMKDPRWDPLVHAALDLWAKIPRGVWKPDDYAQRIQAWKKAVDAGCNDPLVLDLYLVSCSFVKLPPNARIVAQDIVTRMQTSSYPAYCKIIAYLLAINAVRSLPGNPAEDAGMRRQLFDLAIDQWPASLDTPGIFDREIGNMASQLLATAKFLGTDNQHANQLIVAPIVKHNRAIGDFYEGLYLMDIAADRRGYGYAAGISASRMKAAEEYAAQARQLFKKAWLEDPSDPGPAIHMIQVEMLLPTGRDAMELWYHRAIAADPNSVEARGQKLTYLQPQWFGSYDEMIAFGRECLATKNWDAKIPQILVSVHRIIAEQTGGGGKYFANPDVWKDVQDVYEGMLRHAPNDVETHNYYAYLAAISGHKDVARRELAIVGDHPLAIVFRNAKTYNDLRRECGLPEIAFPSKSSPAHSGKTPG